MLTYILHIIYRRPALLIPGLLALLTLGLPACVDLDFDEPPVTGLPNITANTTIQELKALHTPGADDRRIDTDVIIRGIVVADDESGNFFKSLVIQDETGGIELRLNSVGLYNTFPVGREVFVRCQGLYLGDFNGVYQLNGSPEAALEEALIKDHVIGGARDQVLMPDTVTIDGLGADRVSTLIYLPEVQFVAADTSRPYADAVNRQSVNLTLEDCGGNTIILRSSGYADFANTPAPAGRGGLIAVYSVFGNTRQLYIRDPRDLRFDQPRCGQGGGGGPVERLRLRALRDLFTGGATKAPDRRRIRGVVISDRANGNTDPRNLVLQDSAAGIVVRFTAAHSFDLGQEVEIDVSQQNLTEFRGLLQIDGVAIERAAAVGAGALPTPRLTTVAELLTNVESWESTLVRLEGVTLSGGDTYEGSVTAADGTGAVALFTRSAASFAARPLPAVAVDLTAVVGQFNDPQLQLRSLADVSEGNSGGNGPVTELNEPFSSQANDQMVTLSGWTNLAVKGTRQWLAKEFNGNVYAQATAYADTSAEMEAWLITPPIRLEERRLLSFRSAQAFFQHNGLSVWISKDFTGDNFAAATWTELPCRLATNADGQNTWVPSGNVDLVEFDGIVYIGFRYVGTAAANTTTYRIDDVQVRKP